jgi:hypothetical protein
MDKILLIYNVILTLLVVFLFHRTKHLSRQQEFWFNRYQQESRRFTEEISTLMGKIKAPPTITRHMPKPKSKKLIDHVAHGHDHAFVDALKKI